MFKNRKDAGTQLAESLNKYLGREDMLIIVYPGAGSSSISRPRIASEPLWTSLSSGK